MKEAKILNEKTGRYVQMRGTLGISLLYASFAKKFENLALRYAREAKRIYNTDVREFKIYEEKPTFVVSKISAVLVANTCEQCKSSHAQCYDVAKTRMMLCTKCVQAYSTLAHRPDVLWKDIVE